jgi:predicted lactoylglutathione lyase
MTGKLECINPILPVRDVKMSLDYVRVLGFQKADWVSENSNFALVLRDGFGIYLSETRDEHSRVSVWIGAVSLGPIYEEYMTSGAKFHRPPTNYAWAYELVVEDPDGHLLRIGSEPKK